MKNTYLAYRWNSKENAPYNRQELIDLNFDRILRYSDLDDVCEIWRRDETTDTQLMPNIKSYSIL